MPKQNRVTPYGDIIRHPSKAAILTGNRGILHNDEREIVRYSVGKRWIACALDYKGWRQEIMRPGHYTQLFFLDEAVALAAGHRPCALCRNEDFKRFVELWLQANADLYAITGKSIDSIDAVLHSERLSGRGQKRIYQASIEALPNGAYIQLDGDPGYYLVHDDRLLRWSAYGYEAATGWPAGGAVVVLTPRSIVRTLAAGYTPRLHRSGAELT